jgi:hypothetical protein
MPKSWTFRVSIATRISSHYIGAIRILVGAISLTLVGAISLTLVGAIWLVVGAISQDARHVAPTDGKQIAPPNGRSYRSQPLQSRRCLRRRSRSTPGYTPLRRAISAAWSSVFLMGIAFVRMVSSQL